MFDLLIKNALVIDGTGAPRVSGSIGISDGKIQSVGAVSGLARRVIDAEGRVVAPGFVDVHTHYDAQVFWDPNLSPSCFHGVTTVIGGHCGFSIAPLSGNEKDAIYLRRMLARVEGMPEVSLELGVPWDWRSFDEYLSRLDGKLALNAGFLVGHCALRRCIMGERAVGALASALEIEAMAALLRQSLSEGGLGFSSSLSPVHSDGDGNPVPSRSASDEEFFALSRVVREFPGTTLEFAPSQTLYTEDGAERVIAMSLAAQRPLNWNPLNPDSVRPELYKAQLAVSDRAAARGARVVPLVMGNPASLRINLETGFLFDAIPGWDKVMRLPLDRRATALGDPEMRKELQESAKSMSPGLASVVDWKNHRVVETFGSANQPFRGLLVGEIARATVRDAFDTLLDIALADDLKTVFMPAVAAADDESWKLRAEMWIDERTVIGASDAGAHLDMIDTFAFSTHVLQTGVRERALLSLEQAIRQLTSVPAGLMGLKNRGRLNAGGYADIVIFDPNTISSGNVHTRRDLPGGAGRLYADAVGMNHVFVNGIEIVQNGILTGEQPGRVFRSGRDTFTA